MNTRNRQRSNAAQPSHHSTTPPPSVRRAFTLIEMIGALAIVAILAAALVPVVVRRIDQAALTQEVANLNTLSNAIVLQAIRGTNQNLPSANTWAANAAAWAGLPVSAITTTPRNYSRAFLIDTGGWLGTPNLLPYTQTNTGTTLPAKARVMIVSTISTALPVSFPSFDDIWNTPDGTKPATWSTWTGNGRDIVVQRINLQPLFHRVVLFNRDTNVQCYATINGGSQLQFTNQWDAYYLHGSVLGLGTNSNLLLTQVINSDMGRSYESGSWSDQIGAGPPASSTSTNNLDNLAYAFVNSPFPPSTKKGDNTIGVADSLLAYMNAYASWANMNPCFSYGGNGNANKVVEFQLMSTVAACFGGSAQGTCSIVP